MIIKMPVSEYRDLDGINFSSLKHMAESPKSYKWHEDHPTEETAAMAFGTAFHAAVLEPDLFAGTYIARPEGLDGRTKAGKDWAADVEAKGFIVLSFDQAEQIKEMSRNFRGHPLIAPFLNEPGQP